MRSAPAGEWRSRSGPWANYITNIPLPIKYVLVCTQNIEARTIMLLHPPPFPAFFAINLISVKCILYIWVILSLIHFLGSRKNKTISRLFSPADMATWQGTWRNGYSVALCRCRCLPCGFAFRLVQDFQRNIMFLPSQSWDIVKMECPWARYFTLKCFTWLR